MMQIKIFHILIMANQITIDIYVFIYDNAFTNPIVGGVIPKEYKN